MMETVFRIAFLAPQIGPNAGNVIRTAAATGCEFHLIKPLGFDMSDKQLKRAGLDYHDLATVTVHEDFETAYDVWSAAARDSAAPAAPDAAPPRAWHAAPEAAFDSVPPRIYAFSARGTANYSDISYEPGDVLLFGSEHDGLPQAVMDDPRVTAVVRIPMLPARRSLNIANATALVVYEAWRQHGFAGSAPDAPQQPTIDGEFV